MDSNKLQETTTDLLSFAKECGAVLSNEQLLHIASSLMHKHQEEKRLLANNIFSHIEDRVRIIDSGPSHAFDLFNHEQKIAMHELFSVRNFFKI